MWETVRIVERCAHEPTALYIRIYIHTHIHTYIHRERERQRERALKALEGHTYINIYLSI